MYAPLQKDLNPKKQKYYQDITRYSIENNYITSLYNNTTNIQNLNNSDIKINNTHLDNNNKNGNANINKQNKKPVGKKTKNKQKIQPKIKKHLSQLPIDPYTQNKSKSKQKQKSREKQKLSKYWSTTNNMIIIPHRPHSSLINYQQEQKNFNKNLCFQERQKDHSKGSSNSFYYHQHHHSLLQNNNLNQNLNQNNNIIKKKKKHLSVQSIGRQSAISVSFNNNFNKDKKDLNSNLKNKRKSRRNSQSFQQQSKNNSTFKNKLVANRKKYNYSCNQFDEKQKQNKDSNLNNDYKRDYTKQIKQLKQLKQLKDFKNANNKQKNNQTLLSKKLSKNQSKKHSVNNLISQQHIKGKKDNNDKSKPKHKQRLDFQNKQKSYSALTKKKNSFKNKPSLNDSQANNFKKSEKVKIKSKKSKKFIISKDASSQQQYPIQKYILQSIGKQQKSKSRRKQKSNNSRSKSKYQKSSLSRSKRKNDIQSNYPSKKLSFQYPSMIQVENAPYMNALSQSSNIIRSSEISVRSARQRNNQRFIKIANQNEQVQNLQQAASSIDIDQIRFYQKNSPINYGKGIQIDSNSQRKQQASRLKQKQKRQAPFLNQKSVIIQEINNDYPMLSQQEKIFLASVIFIQRKWRQYHFYDKIFRKKSQIKKTQQISTFLNMKQTKMQSITLGQGKSYSPLFEKEVQFQNLNMIKRQDDNLKYSEIIQGDRFKKSLQQDDHYKLQTRINFVQRCQIGIQVEKQLSQKQQRFEQKRQSIQQQQRIQKNNQIKKKSIENQKQYELSPPNSFPHRQNQRVLKFNQTQVFPSLQYLQTRKQMIRASTQKNLDHLYFLYTSREITQSKYLQSKEQLQKQYRATFKQLNKSKRDIKRGYLKFIQCLKETQLLENQLQKSRVNRNAINHNDKITSLRKVSSQSGFMSIVYQKFHQLNLNQNFLKNKFLQCNQSSDSDSLKRLSQKILIRKQYIKNKKQDSAIKLCIKSQISNLSNLNNSQLLHSQRAKNSNQNVSSIFNDSDRTVLIKKKKNISEVLSQRQSFSKQKNQSEILEPLQETLSKNLEQSQLKQQNHLTPPQKIIINSKRFNDNDKINISDFLNQAQQKSIISKSPYSQTLKQQQYDEAPKINIKQSPKIKLKQKQSQNKWSQKLKKFTQQAIEQYQQSSSLQIGQRMSGIIQFEQSDQIKLSKQVQNKSYQYNKIRQEQILNLIYWDLTKQLHQELLLFNNFEGQQQFEQQYHGLNQQFFDKQNIQQTEQKVHLKEQFSQLSSQSQQQVLVRRRSQSIQPSQTKTKQQKQQICLIVKKLQQENKNKKIQPFLQQKFQIAQISNYQSSNNHKISPLSSYRQSNQSEQIQQMVSYLNQFIVYIQSDQDLLKNTLIIINQDQGFSALTYLKFLRDFQLPQDDYQPIISNQTFISWQTHYFRIHQINFGNNGDIDYILKQSQTIFHRCLFQGLVSQLQKRRRYGQKGMAFPWQTCSVHTPIINRIRLNNIFIQSLNQIKKICSYKCGIIDNKYIYGNQEQLQKIHEQNEDRIICMLQDQLDESGDNWYQLEQHILQSRLQVCMVVEQHLFEQICKQIAFINAQRIQRLLLQDKMQPQ